MSFTSFISRVQNDSFFLAAHTIMVLMYEKKSVVDPSFCLNIRTPVSWPVQEWLPTTLSVASTFRSYPPRDYTWWLGYFSCCMSFPRKIQSISHPRKETNERPNYPTKVQVGEPLTLLGLFTGVWVRGYSQEHGWLKGGYITEKPIAAWVISQQKLHPGAPCRICRQHCWPISFP